MNLNSLSTGDLITGIWRSKTFLEYPVAERYLPTSRQQKFLIQGSASDPAFPARRRSNVAKLSPRRLVARYVFEGSSLIRRFASVDRWLQEKDSTRNQESETISRASAIVDVRGLASFRSTTEYTIHHYT